MKIHTVFVTHNRLELTKIAIESWLQTVSTRCSLAIVDNASEDGTREWLEDFARNAYVVRREGWERPADIVLLPANRFPGFAANRGWELAPPDTTILHRADNDFRFLPGWCEALAERFEDPQVGQVGLRTDEEECFAPMNVGGNCAIRRALWDAGLRYDERPWGHPDIPKGWTEDSLLSPAVVEMGYEWTRVTRPCIEPTSVEDPDDPYYQRTWRLRGITPPPRRRRGGQPA